MNIWLRVHTLRSMSALSCLLGVYSLQACSEYTIEHDPPADSSSSGSSSGGRSNSGGNGEGGSSGSAADAQYLAACTALADHLKQLGCDDLNSEAKVQAHIDNCYGERLQMSGACNQEQLSCMSCQVAAPLEHFECVEGKSLLKFPPPVCEDEFAALLDCILSSSGG